MTIEEPGSTLLTTLKTRYGIAASILEKMGAFIVMWAAYENDLEKAIWRLTGENPEGKYPTTDMASAGTLLKRFNEAAFKWDGDNWHEVVGLICETSDHLVEYRNCIAHGELLPASVGGGILLNPRWHRELRRRSARAHIDDRLVGLMLDALLPLLRSMREIKSGQPDPNKNEAILAQRDALCRACSTAGEVRYLASAMNSEKY